MESIGPTGREPLTEERLASAAAWLARRDPILAGILARRGTPPLWARRPGFLTLIRIILEQQVSLASAAALFARLRRELGPLSSGRLEAIGEEPLMAAGLTRQKAAYCVSLARAVRGRDLDLRALSRMDDAEARARLTRVKGIGDWTAGIYLLMALRRPDVWPTGDLALAAALARLKGRRAPMPAASLERAAEAWRPFRSVAARMLWQDYLARRAGRAAGVE